ncbi:MAG: hypothetical protein P4L22_05370 [Candidatus Babeliales bacterium]|nr:hypothetical protein [Candidatus Babeliales bacterium]
MKFLKIFLISLVIVQSFNLIVADEKGRPHVPAHVRRANVRIRKEDKAKQLLYNLRLKKAGQAIAGVTILALSGLAYYYRAEILQKVFKRA